MRVTHVAAEARSSLVRLGRNRTALALVVLLPLLFLTVVVVTTPRRVSTVELASVPEEEMAMPPLVPIHAPPRGAVIEAPERSVAAVFVVIAAVGVAAALLALDLIQKDAGATRRLVLCGRRPVEILAGRLVALAVVLAATTATGAVLVRAIVDAERLPLVVLGIALAAAVHAAWGLLVGAVCRRDLVGILLVALLVNVDAGWLQNPAYYATAEHRALIEALPAHGPAQVALVAAFSDYPITKPSLLGAGYAAALLAGAALVFTLRLCVARRNGRHPTVEPPAGREVLEPEETS